MELENMKKSTTTQVSSCSDTDVMSPPHVRRLNQNRGKIQQTERASPSAGSHNISVFAFGRKHFVLSLFQSITPSLALIFPFIQVLTLPGEREKALHVANGKHFLYGIYSKTSQLQMS